MKDATKQKILTAIDGASESEFYILDSFGKNYGYIIPPTWTTPLRPTPYRVRLEQAAPGLAKLPEARLKVLFEEPMAGVLQENLGVECI